MERDEDAIRAVVATWHRATGAGDVDAVLALMTQDATFLGVGRPPMHSRAAFEQALRMLLTMCRKKRSSTAAPGLVRWGGVADGTGRRRARKSGGLGMAGMSIGATSRGKGCALAVEPVCPENRPKSDA